MFCYIIHKKKRELTIFSGLSQQFNIILLGVPIFITSFYYKKFGKKPESNICTRPRYDNYIDFVFQIIQYELLDSLI